MLEKPYIVIGEDDHAYAHVFHTRLTHDGYEVEVCANGDEVLHALRKRKPHVLLLDLLMPTKDGFDTLKEIKEDKELKDVRVLVASNLSQENDISRAMNLGAEKYFIKSSVSVGEVVEELKRALEA